MREIKVKTSIKSDTITSDSLPDHIEHIAAQFLGLANVLKEEPDEHRSFVDDVLESGELELVY